MRRSLRPRPVLAFSFALALVLAAATAASAAASSGTKINVANPNVPFAPNKSAEGFVAIDAHRPNIVAAGAFDEADEAPCGTAESTPDNPCPFVTGVGTSGVYFSFDRGRHWMQPSFTGWTARNGTAHFGTIHTLPWYYETGIVSDADSAGTIGPRPVHGNFSWANGSRFYYANLTSAIPAPPSEIAFKGYERVAVSRIDNPTSAARVSKKRNWFRPVIVPSHSAATAFEDKEQIWADNVASSPFFGHVYLCFAEYRGASSFPQLNEPEVLKVATSTDGGSNWSVHHIGPAATGANQPHGFGRSGCTIRTDSHGVVYLFYQTAGFGHFGTPGFGAPAQDTVTVVKSFDGGLTWTSPRALFKTTALCQYFDAVEFRCVADGTEGARTDLSDTPSVDIANGAPNGNGATNEIVMSWADARFGLNHEKVMVAESMNRGRSFSHPTVVPGIGRGYYSAPAISPDGHWLYLSNSWVTTPFRRSYVKPRIWQNTFDRAAIAPDGSPLGFTHVAVGQPGDNRAAAFNGLCCEFDGDYNYASAARSYGVGVWTADLRNARPCPAINRWRDALEAGSTENPPNPASACPGRFGNVDIYGATSG